MDELSKELNWDLAIQYAFIEHVNTWIDNPILRHLALTAGLVEVGICSKPALKQPEESQRMALIIA